MKRLLVATDAWHPQVNGVVRTLAGLKLELERRGVEVLILSPADYATLPCPTYPEIRLALAGGERTDRLIRRFRPDHIHIATEGPIGLRVRRAALVEGRAFTTSFHTRYPEYVRQRAPIPPALTYRYLRWFHSAGSACLVPSTAIRDELARRGFGRLVTWTRGVDRSLFRPGEVLSGSTRPRFLTVSRIAPEKNLEAFLDLDLPGEKIVVGDGPMLAELKTRYPAVRFTGLKTGEALAECYRSADVFVFPSRSDTFGVVLLEAMASGLPVAAFPEPGPIDVVGTSGAGILADDLRMAAMAALAIPRERALRRAADFTWERCADMFLLAIDGTAGSTLHAIPEAA